MSAAGFDAGSVRLRLTLADDRVARAEARCERPDVAARLVGRPAIEAAGLVPLIYSLCGSAQGIAARVALAAARGAAPAAHVDALAAAEGAREHAWKLLVDWPRQLGLPGDEPLFVRVAKARAGDAALAETLRDHALPTALAARLGAAAVDRHLAARLAERLAALLAFLEGRPQPLGRVAAETLGPGQGRACVETARGELVHKIALAGDTLAGYVIVAPTDRLFGPDGPLPAWLEGTATAGAAERAERALMALDPCVPWTLEIA